MEDGKLIMFSESGYYGSKVSKILSKCTCGYGLCMGSFSLPLSKAQLGATEVFRECVFFCNYEWEIAICFEKEQGRWKFEEKYSQGTCELHLSPV